MGRPGGGDSCRKISFVISLVNADGAALPKSGRFYPFLIKSALLDEILAQGFGGDGLGGNPGVALPRRQRQTGQRVLQQRSRSGGGSIAMQPSDLDRRAAGKLLLFFSTCNLGDDHCAGARRQFVQAPADGRQGGLVANE